MKKLEFEKFEGSILPNNQLRSISGGRNTTWRTLGGGSGGTDTAEGGNTSFSDGSSSDKDSKLVVINRAGTSTN